jgi:hypothetical protein
MRREEPPPPPGFRAFVVNLEHVPPGRCPACYQPMPTETSRVQGTTIRVCNAQCARNLRGYLSVTKARQLHELHRGVDQRRDLRDGPGVDPGEGGARA